MFSRLEQGLKIFALVGALAAVSAVLASCGGSGDDGGGSGTVKLVNQGVEATQTPPPVVVIKISDNKFEPAEVTVKAGTKVRWEWSGNNPHSVLIGGNASEQKTGSGTFERDFRGGGSSFPYQCGVHGAAMTGKIIVE